MKIKQTCVKNKTQNKTCVKKTTSANGRETKLKNFQDLVPSDKDCLTPPMSTKSQSLFLTVVTSFSMFTRRLILQIYIKVDSYNCIPIAFFIPDRLPFGFYFIIYPAMVFSVICIRTIFPTFSVLILFNNSSVKNHKRNLQYKYKRNRTW